MRKLTILVDMDDVLNNLVESWIHYLNERYSTNVSVEDVLSWDITKAFPTLSIDDIYAPSHIDEFWETVKPNIDNIEYLNQIINDGYKVVLVTASKYQTIYKKFEMFFKYCPYLSWDDVIVTSQKQMIKGDVLIDDGIHNLEGGDYLKFLIDRPHNRYFDADKNGIKRIKSIKEGYALIQQYPEVI